MRLGDFKFMFNFLWNYVVSQDGATGKRKYILTLDSAHLQIYTRITIVIKNIPYKCTSRADNYSLIKACCCC